MNKKKTAVFTMIFSRMAFSSCIIKPKATKIIKILDTNIAKEDYKNIIFCMEKDLNENERQHSNYYLLEKEIEKLQYDKGVALCKC